MKDKHLFRIILFLLWGYLILRAIYVQPIHDEIATFFSFVQTGRFLPYFADWTTNNHILNSLLTFVSFHLFGPSPLALRLPNLLAFPVFIIFLWKIAGEINNRYIRWAFFLSVVLIHNFLEFFALSRGYGLALALLAAGIWFTLQALNTGKTRYYIYALIAGTFSVSAILIYVNSLIIMSVLLIAKTIHNDRDHTRKMFQNLTCILVFGIVPIILTVIYLFDLNSAGKLDYGGSDGFWEESVKDLTKLLAGNQSPLFNFYIIILTIFMVVAFLFQYIRAFGDSQKFKTFFNNRWLLFYLLAGNIFGFFLEHQLFGILYPANRTALQFIVFFLGSAFFLLDGMAKNYKVIFGFLFLPLMFFPVQFINSINLYDVTIEKESIPYGFLEKVKEKSDPGQPPPTIQGYSGRELRWAYMNYRDQSEMSIVQWSAHPGLDADFQIIYPDKNPVWRQYYDSIDSDRHSGLYLIERKNKLEKVPLAEQSAITPIGPSNDEFLGISDGSLDLLTGSTIYATYGLRFISSKKHVTAWIVFAVMDKDDNLLRYERLPLNWYNRDWRTDERPFINGLLICEIPENAVKYTTYIWNLYKAEVNLEGGKFALSRLEKDY